MNFKTNIFLLAFGLLFMGQFASAEEPVTSTTTLFDSTTGEPLATSNSTTFLVDSGPLVITKSADKGIIDVGEEVTFTVTVTNKSLDATALNTISLIDHFPSEFLEIVNLTFTAGMLCQSDATEVRCQVDTLASGGSVSATIVYNAIASGIATNIVEAIDADGNVGNVLANVLVRDIGDTLLLTKSVNSGNVDPGEEVVFTTVLTNRSTGATAHNILLTDDFDESGLEFVSMTASPLLNCQNTGDRITCQADSLVAGGSVNIVSRFTAIDTGTYANPSSISALNYPEKSITSALTVTDPNNLFLLTKSADRENIEVGEVVTFIVNIGNRSDTTPIKNVSITDNYPETLLALEEITVSPGLTCQTDAVEIRCQAVEIAPGETMSFTVQYRSVAPGQAINMVAVQDEGAQTGEISAHVIVVDPGDVFLVTKTPNKTRAEVGESVEYVVNITNKSGALTIPDVIITDVFDPDQLQIDAVTSTPGMECTFDAQAITCLVSSFDPSQVHTISTRFTALQTGIVTNTVDVNSPQNHTGKGASSIIVNNPGNPLVITKVANKAIIETDEEVEYLITISNKGGVRLEDVVLTDVFPNNLLTLEEVTAEGTTCTNTDAEITCQIDVFDPDDVYTILSRFRGTASGTATNTATLSNVDFIRETSANVVILDPGNILLVSKAPNKNIIEVGEEVEYTITISNRTDAQVLSDVNISDDFPQDMLELLEVTTPAGLDCSWDADVIQCNIQDMQPQSVYTMITRYKAVASGDAVNTISLESPEIESGETGSTITILEPIIRSLHMSSECEGVNVLIGQKCIFTTLASYLFAEQRDVSQEVTIHNYDPIGTLEVNKFTATTAGTSNITTSIDDMVSNPITIKVISGIRIGNDENGNIITHVPLRTSGGEDTIRYMNPIPIGADDADIIATAKYNRIIFSGYGGGGAFTWFLEDRTKGTLFDFNANQECDASGIGRQCENTNSVVFESAQEEGMVTLRVSDGDGNIQDIILHILPPALSEILLTHNGEIVPESMSLPITESLSFGANGIFRDGSVEANVQEDMQWEFQYNSGVWGSTSEDGNISGGFFQPLKNGTYRIRVKVAQNIAFPGSNGLTQKSEEIFSKILTVSIGDAVPYIDSLRTAGNEGFATGTHDTLFARLRHYSTFANIGDIELSLVRGKFHTPEEIPTSAQYFTIDLVDEDIIRRHDADKSVLLEIPFFIPLLQDITDGFHTLRLSVQNKNGFDGVHHPTSVLPIYIGQPRGSDADLDGDITLRDAVLAMRVVSGTLQPSSLQTLTLDIDGQNGITLKDFILGFQVLLRNFLQS